jgi:hypothetical protein
VELSALHKRRVLLSRLSLRELSSLSQIPGELILDAVIRNRTHIPVNLLINLVMPSAASLMRSQLLVLTRHPRAKGLALVQVLLLLLRLVFCAERDISFDELKHALIALCEVVLGTLVLLLLDHLGRLITRYRNLVTRRGLLKNLWIVEGVHEH